MTTYKGYTIKVEAAKDFGTGFLGLYRCYRAATLIYQGSVVGNIDTVERAELEAIAQARRRIDRQR